MRVISAFPHTSYLLRAARDCEQLEQGLAHTLEGLSHFFLGNEGAFILSEQDAIYTLCK